MKAVEIRDLSTDEIESRITETQEELFRLRFRSATQQIENPALIKTLRRDVARMRTILSERSTQSGGTDSTAAAEIPAKPARKAASRKGQKVRNG